MKKSLLVSAFLVAMLASAALAGGKTYVGTCSATETAAYKPAKILVACGDGNLVLRHLKWSSWGARSAHGKGTASVNSCLPSCAQGHFKNYPVKVKLGRRRACSGKHALQFRRVTYTYTGDRPKGVRATGRATRVCGR